MEQLGFFHLLEVEKKPVFQFEDIDPVAYLWGRVSKPTESEECEHPNRT